MISGFLRLTGFILIIFAYISTSTLFLILPFRSSYKDRKLPEMVSFWCKLVLKCLGIKVNFLESSDKREGKKGRLIVANHLSYMDIFIISSCYSGMYVTSTDVENTKFLGLITKIARCIFVNRKNYRKNLGEEVEKVTNYLKNGYDVIVFPEATTTDATALKPFKPALFDSALAADCEILPLCLNYRTYNGKPITNQNNDEIFWYGDMTFGDHVANFCIKNRALLVELKELENLEVSGFNRKELAMICQERITEHFSPVFCG